MAYWLVKSDPKTYSWEDMKNDKSTPWDGVRNYQARNNLRAMKTGDIVMFYHSQEDREIVGITEVTKEAFQDPTTEDSRWIAVELSNPKGLDKKVSLQQLKNHSGLQNIALIKQARLSVMPITEKEYRIIMEISQRD